MIGKAAGCQGSLDILLKVKHSLLTHSAISLPSSQHSLRPSFTKEGCCLTYCIFYNSENVCNILEENIIIMPLYTSFKLNILFTFQFPKLLSKCLNVTISKNLNMINMSHLQTQISFYIFLDHFLLPWHAF